MYRGKSLFSYMIPICDRNRSRETRADFVQFSSIWQFVFTSCFFFAARALEKSIMILYFILRDRLIVYRM